MTEIDALKAAEGDGLKSSQNASSSHTSPQNKDKDQTTIQNNEPDPSTSKSKGTPENQNNPIASISDVNVDVVKQLDSLLTKSTSEFDELKSLLKEYLKTEKNNKSPSSDKNVKFTLTGQDDKKPGKKIKPPSRSSSNSDISLSNQDMKSKKKMPTPGQVIDSKKKSKVIQIKETSKSTKTIKCELSDISESNEMERNSSSSDAIKIKPTPIKKQNKVTKPSYTRKGPSASKPALTKNKQELILNIASKSSSSLTSSNEDRSKYIHDFIQRSPKDPNKLINPPNTERLPQPQKITSPNPLESKKDICDSMKPSCKKTCLGVQILPSLDIRRSLTTQKLPDVAIESIDDFVYSMSSENVKYIQITHNNDKDLPKIKTPEPAEKILPVIDKAKSDSDISPRSKNEKPCLAKCNQKATHQSDKKIEEIYIAPKQISTPDSSFREEEIPSPSKKHFKDIPEKKATVSEELNLDIDSLPSVRTLKEIQNYLEQKCALIRSRLHEESKLKTGETLSLRYKLSQPPLWQSSITESENNKNSPHLEQNPKPTILGPLKTYESIKTPLSPLQKHDKSQQFKPKPTPVNNTKKSPVKVVDKSLQVSISENIEMPIARKDDTCCSPQFSIETSNKDIHDFEEDFNTPSLSLPKTVREITQEQSIVYGLRSVSIQKDKPQEIDTTNLKLENQVTKKSLTFVNNFSEISTQINEYNYVKQPQKRVSFQVVTNQFSFIPNENKETQVPHLDVVEEMTQTPIETKKENSKTKVEKAALCKNEKTQTNVCKENTFIKNETINKEKETPPIVRYIHSNATQTVKDKCTTCNIQQKEEEIKPPSNVKETKECCTQYSPIQEQLDATEYKKINSFTKFDRSDHDEQSKRVHYSPEQRRYCYKSKIKNKRAPPKHKICSTPVSSSSLSTGETVSLSDGEFKLTCECSTSIGEIHLCRFANDIRKKVRILKQHPEEIFKESFGGDNFKMKGQHKYNDNWYAYYVTKTDSSSEHGTGSNLSSIKSNIETE